MGYKFVLKCNQITLVIKLCPENTPYLWILYDKEVQMISFITAVEFNLHNFQLQ